MYDAFKVELPIFVAVAVVTFSALIMGVHHIINLTSQTKFSGLFLLPHSMVEAMAMVKKTAQIILNPPFFLRSTTLPKTNIAPEKSGFARW